MFQASVSGNVDSRKAEAEVLLALGDLIEDLGAKASGTFSFSGEHFGAVYGGPADAAAQIKKLVDDYNAAADADDQVGVPADPDSDDGTSEESTPETSDDAGADPAASSDDGTTTTEDIPAATSVDASSGATVRDRSESPDSVRASIEGENASPS